MSPRDRLTPRGVDRSLLFSTGSTGTRYALDGLEAKSAEVRNTLSRYTNAVRGTVSEGIKDLVAWEPAGEFLSTLYDKGMGVADLATQAALERGSSGTEAFWGSMAVGTANMLIYEYGVGGLMKLAGPVDPSTVEGMLSGAFKRAGVTATAGATSELSRILIDTAAMGNSSEFDLEVKLLRMEGMSAEEAWRQTFTDYVERVVDTGVRSGRYGLIAGLSEYGGEYFRQHPEAFNALVSGKTGWSGGMQGLTPGGAQGLLGLPGATLAPGGRMEGMPMLPGPAAVKDDWETALEEAVTEWKGAKMRRSEKPEGIDISRGNDIIFDSDTEGAGELLPNVEKVTVDTRKVTEYALNPNNTSGGANKARVFESVLGYNQSNSNHLMQQIQNKLPTSKAILGKADKYGRRFTVDIPITGPNGKTAIVRTGWILEPGSDVPRMTTIFVK